MDGFVDPNKILNEVELRKDMTAAEFGCGSGFFSIFLAKMLKDGKVYGLDVQQEPLSVLKARAKIEGFSNIETIRCDLEKEFGSTLANDFLDLVLIPNVLFQAENKEAVIKEAHRILKKDGRILIIDWKPESLLGPKQGKISVQEVKKLVMQTGLKLEKEFDAGKFHYGIIFTKS